MKEDYYMQANKGRRNIRRRGKGKEEKPYRMA